jgi:hypothetical protein
MATNIAQKRGAIVRMSAAKRLENREERGVTLPRHKAAVFPASQRVMNVIPAKAPDECPDGKDFLPCRIRLASLNG